MIQPLLPSCQTSQMGVVIQINAPWKSFEIVSHRQTLVHCSMVRLRCGLRYMTDHSKYQLISGPESCYQSCLQRSTHSPGKPRTKTALAISLTASLAISPPVGPTMASAPHLC